MRLGASLVLILLIICFSAPQENIQLDDNVILSSEIDGDVAFGSNSGSIFDIDPASSIGINVNFSSDLDLETDVLITINGPSGWDISWNSQNHPGEGHEYAISPNQIVWVQFSVTSPPVIGGYPLSNSLHDVSMSLIYDQGGRYDWYNFSMRYGYFEGVEIVEGGGSSSIAPGGSVTLETVVRNTGNTVRTLDVEIVALGDDGSIISNPGGYFFLDNWSASIIESWRMVDIYPNSTGIVMVQIFSPGDVEGALNFEIRISSPASVGSFSSTSHIVNIVPRIGGEISFSEDNCSTEETLPGAFCEMSIIVTNTGDSDSIYNLEILNIPQWSSIEYQDEFFSLRPGESSEEILISCHVREGVSSGLYSEVRIELMIDDWSPGHVDFIINSGTLYAWEMNMSYYLTNSNNLTATWTMTNLGNGIDGFVASIDSSVVTEFGITVTDSFSSMVTSESSRALEIYPVNQNDSVDVIAWMEVPNSAPTETVANLSIEIRSFLDPSIVFIDSIPVIIQGEIPPENDDLIVNEDWIVPLVNTWFEPLMILIVVIIGTFGVVRALRISNSKAGDNIISEEEDWIQKFDRKDESVGGKLESPEVDHEKFEKDFFGDNGRTESESIRSIDKDIVYEAGELLDRSKEDSDIEESLRIAEILEDQDILHPDNIILDIDDKALFSEENISDNQVPSGFDLEI